MCGILYLFSSMRCCGVRVSCGVAAHEIPRQCRRKNQLSEFSFILIRNRFSWFYCLLGMFCVRLSIFGLVFASRFWVWVLS